MTTSSRRTQRPQPATVDILRPDLALLWLLIYAPDAIDFDQPKKMVEAVQTMGRGMPLEISRYQIEAIVDELLTKVSWFVIGDIRHADGDVETVFVELEAADGAAARQQLERSLIEAHGADWNWLVPPSISPATRLQETVRISEPIPQPENHTTD